MRAARGAIGLGRFAWPRTAVPHARAVSAQTLAPGAIGECKARARGYNDVPRYDPPALPFCFTQISGRTRFAVYPLRCSLGLLGFALRDSAAARPRQGRRRARGAARSRVGPPESLTPAAPSDPERR